MFNVHQYEKKLQQKKKIDKQKYQFIEDQEKRKHVNNKLSQNYKKRVENFVINMLENPMEITEFKAPKAYKIRDEKPEKFIGDAQFYVKGFKHEKDRINESQKRSQDLDYFPNTVFASHNFRPRDKSKEIQEDMKFTSKTSLERIEAFLKQHMQTQVENADFRNERKKKNGDNAEISIWENDKMIPNSLKRRAILARDVAKNLLPSLHNKTHFQAAELMYNAQPLSIVDKSKTFHKSTPNLLTNELTQVNEMRNSKQQISKDGKGVQIYDPNEDTTLLQDDEKKGNSQKTDQMEAFNPVETSMKVLKECKIIKEKNPKVKTIHPGSGHLISMNDKSISEIYDQFYPRTVHSKFPNVYSTSTQFNKTYQ